MGPQTEGAGRSGVLPVGLAPYGPGIAVLVPALAPKGARVVKHVRAHNLWISTQKLWAWGGG